MSATIVTTPNSFEHWHVINGLWVHIAQTVDANHVVHYFVDGVEQALPSFSPQAEAQ